MKEVELTQGKVALVDDEDEARVIAYGPWFFCRSTGYAHTYVGRSIMLLHRFIMNAKEGEEVDHRFGDRLDEQKKNLRIATRQNNCFNMRKKTNCSSIYKGVYWRTQRAKWYSQIMVNGKRFHLGAFDNEIEAARAYDIAALHHFKEFAKVNTYETTEKN